jgi:hypothetical protein
VEARVEPVTAGAAEFCTVALAVLGRHTTLAFAPLFAYFAYRLSGHTVVDDPRVWAGIAAFVDLIVAVL